MAKMSKKIPLEVQKGIEKLPPNWKIDLKHKNDENDKKLPIKLTFL
jgi:hypothetical protein